MVCLWDIRLKGHQGLNKGQQWLLPRFLRVQPGLPHTYKWPDMVLAIVVWTIFFCCLMFIWIFNWNSRIDDSNQSPDVLSYLTRGDKVRNQTAHPYWQHTMHNIVFKLIDLPLFYCQFFGFKITYSLLLVLVSW